MPEGAAKSMHVDTEHQLGFDLVDTSYTHDAGKIQVTGWLSGEAGLDGVHALFVGLIHLKSHGSIASSGEQREETLDASMLLESMLLERHGERLRVTLGGTPSE
jgi:hypothetical protein